MSKQFQDLSITGLIGERCYAIEGSILRIHLRLSEPPPLGWSYLFTQVWQGVEYPGKRPAGIEDNALWIECAPEEVRACHLAQLEQALAETNSRYRAQNLQQEIAAERKRELGRLTHAKLDTLAKSFVPIPQSTEPANSGSQTRTSKVLKFFRRLFAAPVKSDCGSETTTA